MNRISASKSVFVATFAHVAASATLVFLPELYSKTHAGNEAWPVLIPVVMAAFGLETLFLFLIFRLQRGAAFLLKLSLVVLVSWIAGMASFLTFDAFAGSLPYKPPQLSWLLSLAILLVMVRRLERKAS